MLEPVEALSEKLNRKNRIAVQSVFLPRENIFFLKEWLAYHIEIGADHFYLYDNTGSIGRDGSDQAVNKYGIPYAKITGGMSDNDIQDIMHEIENDFPGRVTYIKWAPVNEQGKIEYGWNESLQHFIENYGVETEWTAFIDIDEFIFSVEDKNLKEYVGEYEQNGYADLLLLQKKFDERFNNLDRYVIKIDKCIEGINTFGWAPKHIIRTDMIDLESLINKTKVWDMHNIHKTGGKHAVVDVNELRFNHYNVNKEQFKWMKWFYNTSENYYFNGQDDSMKRYWNVIESKCERNSTMDLLRRFPSPM